MPSLPLFIAPARFDDPADAPQVAQFMADKLEQLKDANSELGEALAGQQGIEQFRAFVESLPKLPPGAAQEQPPEIAANSLIELSSETKLPRCLEILAIGHAAGRTCPSPSDA